MACYRWGIVTTEIKRFNLVSVAKFFGVIGLVQGAVFGLPAILIGFAAGAGVGGDSGAGVVILGILMYAIFAVLAGLFSAISGAIGALVYNLVSSASGGIEVELIEEVRTRSEINNNEREPGNETMD